MGRAQENSSWRTVLFVIALSGAVSYSVTWSVRINGQDGFESNPANGDREASDEEKQAVIQYYFRRALDAGDEAKVDVMVRIAEEQGATVIYDESNGRAVAVTFK